MTPIGHTLTGLAIGHLAVPSDWPRKQRRAAYLAFAILASVPDLPLPYWGHFNLEVSHSLVIALCAGVTIGLVLWLKYRGRAPFTRGVLIGGALAWCSHILLDSFYNHAIGLPISWPLGKFRLALPIPWLATGNKYDLLSMHNVRVAFYEILTFGTLLLVAIACRKFLLRYKPVTGQAENRGA